ncbi:MAG: ATP-dependent zinc metalloprotease FtsH [Christensenellaceae bacterium]|jgi:cell division protease FtsH|nr:ATP-dependent zinc metalloprotease FtsH [Christensenellaceae bacterium]
MSKNNTRLFLMISVVIIIVILLVIFLKDTSTPNTISYSELIEGVKNNVTNDDHIVGIYFVGSYEVNVLYKKDESHLEDFKNGKFKSATAIVIYRDNLAVTLEELLMDVPIEDRPYISLNDPDSGSFLNYLFPALTFLLILGLAVLFIVAMKKGNGASGALTFAKTNARVTSNVKVRFNDVAGAEEEKEELKEVVEFLKAPRKFRQVGARIPKGVLLVGNPGTGKTLFAKAVAGEADVPFFSISGSDFVEMFVGVGASRVRHLFSQAKRNQPCIVFIDEIDAVGRKRGAGLGGGNDEREQTLNQLLVQMDGFDENDGVVIMAATNRSDVLDPALLRPGRFDRHVYVNMPDVKGREGIFRVHTRNKPIAPDIDFKQLARITTGFSGADIENLLNEAAILAARDNRTVILMVDIKEGINKVLLGPQKRSRVVTEKDKRTTAYHEAGHAIVGHLLKYCEDIQEVSIVPRGPAAGYTLSKAKNDDMHQTKNKFNDEIAMSLGGRAAEEIIIMDVSAGAAQDLKVSTSIARRMVTDYGMSDALPNIFFGGEQEVFIGRDYQTQSVHSEAVATIIDNEIRKIIDYNYGRAMTILKENIDALNNTVKLLFEHETIYGDELALLIDGKTCEEVTKYINDKKAEQDRITEERRIALEQANAARAKAAIDTMKKLEASQHSNYNRDSSFSAFKNRIVPEPGKTDTTSSKNAESNSPVNPSNHDDLKDVFNLDNKKDPTTDNDTNTYRPVGHKPPNSNDQDNDENNSNTSK